MKKIFLTLVSVLIINILSAQSFDKGNRNLDINLGLSIFNSSLKDNNSSDPASTGKASCTLIAPAMEWGVGKRISLGGSMGSAFDFHIAGRFYVSDKIGIIANLGFPSYTFKKFGDNLTDTFTLKF